MDLRKGKELAEWRGDLIGEYSTNMIPIQVTVLKMYHSK